MTAISQRKLLPKKWVVLIATSQLIACGTSYFPPASADAAPEIWKGAHGVQIVGDKIETKSGNMTLGIFLPKLTQKMFEQHDYCLMSLTRRGRE